MNKIKAIIVDDEPGARATLSSMLKNFCPNVQLMAEVDSVSNAFIAINTYSPDVVFLDIKIGGENGFDLLDKFRNRNFHVIFTTAYTEFGIQAIRESALDYLVKPINIEELIVAVGKIPSSEQVISEISKILFPTNQGHEVVAIANIVFCEADNNYTLITLKEGRKITASKTLKKIEDQLPESLFLRTHRSFLVNLNEVKSISKGQGGTVLMSNEQEVLVSRDQKENLLLKIANL